MALLETRNLTRRFAGLTAVDGFSFAVEEGTIHGLIGPNGAGKSTTYNVISGFYAPTSGQVLYDNRNISGLPPHRIAQQGLIRSFQGASIYQEFSVFDNVLAGCHLGASSGLLTTVIGLNRQREKAAVEKTQALLDRFELSGRAAEIAANLPHGLQRRLGIAVAMAAGPRMLLLDEPFTGMNVEETEEMMTLVSNLRDQGTTLLIVEHDMRAVMGLCDTITVMNFGRFLAEGDPETIRYDSNVIEAYLGSTDNAATG